jgi:hypothetical protein
MSKRISDEQRIEEFFMNATSEQTERMVDRIALIRRLRNHVPAETKKPRSDKGTKRGPKANAQTMLAGDFTK